MQVTLREPHRSDMQVTPIGISTYLITVVNYILAKVITAVCETGFLPKLSSINSAPLPRLLKFS